MNKGRACCASAASWASTRRVLAIGDSDNDIPVLEAAGYAVAMGNSTDGVKAVADWMAPPVEEDGAALALHRLVLGEDM